MIPEPMSGCHLWTAAVFKSGYGAIGLGRVKDGIGLAHRVSWTLYRGPIGEGLDVCHRCDNRCCVNPDHLFLGTRKDNVDDMFRKGRQRDYSKALRGESHPNAKLCENSVRMIRALRSQGLTYVEIARATGVSKPQVASVVTRRTWRHVQ